MNAEPFALAGAGLRLRSIAAFRTNRDTAVADIEDVAIHRARHNVLRHILAHVERLLHLGEVLRRGHGPGLLDQTKLSGIRGRNRVGLTVLVRPDRTVVRYSIATSFQST